MNRISISVIALLLLTIKICLAEESKLAPFDLYKAAIDKEFMSGDIVTLKQKAIFTYNFIKVAQVPDILKKPISDYIYFQKPTPGHLLYVNDNQDIDTTPRSIGLGNFNDLVDGYIEKYAKSKPPYPEAGGYTVETKDFYRHFRPQIEKWRNRLGVDFTMHSTTAPAWVAASVVTFLTTSPDLPIGTPIAINNDVIYQKILLSIGIQPLLAIYHVETTMVFADGRVAPIKFRHAVLLEVLSDYRIRITDKLTSRLPMTDGGELSPIRNSGNFFEIKNSIPGSLPMFGESLIKGFNYLNTYETYGIKILFFWIHKTGKAFSVYRDAWKEIIEHLLKEGVFDKSEYDVFELLRQQMPYMYEYK